MNCNTDPPGEHRLAMPNRLHKLYALDILYRESLMGVDELPEPIRSDVSHAIEVLKSLGARDVYLFGSVLTQAAAESIGDIDFAVSGLPPRSFFRAYGALIMSMKMPFDLVDLDNESAFVRALREEGRLERVA